MSPRRVRHLPILVGLAVAASALGLGRGAAAQPPPGSAARALPPISAEAKQHFVAGVSLLQDPEGERVEEAYREFKVAYEISGSPKILGNMGYCAMRLERDGEAVDAYARYLREVPDIDPDERNQIVRDLQTLSVGVVRLSVEVNKPGVRLVDVRVPVRGERVTNTYGPLDRKLEAGIRPGHHILTARLDGHEDVTWEFEAFAGSRETHAFVMKEPPPRVVSGEGGRSTKVLPWVVAGTGAAILTAGAITGIVALGKTNDIARSCPDDLCPSRGFDLEAKRSSARDWVRVTDVLLVAGTVVTAGGIVWLLVSPSDKAPAARSATPRFGGALLPSGGFGSVQVGF